MSDLISRQQAMALRFTRAINEDGIIYVPLGEYLKGIKSLPSTPQWIPCSERLPRTKDDYIITVKDKYGTWTDYVEWSADCHWWGHDDDMVIAWMPLPEPYKGEERQ